MRARILLAVAYALILALWTYADQKSIDLFPGSQEDPAAIGFAAFSVLAGMAVGRWWVLLSPLGGLLPLVYLQSTGYLGHGFDGADPIAPSSISDLIWWGVFLALGVGLRILWDRFRAQGGPRTD